MKRTLIVFAAFTVTLGCAAQKPKPFAHGYKTSRVIVTRFHISTGQFLKIEFPMNPYDADSAEIETILERHGCGAIEGGGYPGAPQYVSCKGVSDVASANKKALEIIPPLDRLMRKYSRRF